MTALFFQLKSSLDEKEHDKCFFHKFTSMSQHQWKFSTSKYVSFMIKCIAKINLGAKDRMREREKKGETNDETKK